MQLKISDRAKECTQTIQELSAELSDYNNIIICIRALQSVTNHPEKFQYEQSDYDKVVSKLYNLCAKHEIPLPTTDYVDWNSIEII